VRLGVGARLRYDGESVEVVEVAATGAGMVVAVRDGRGRYCRIALRELLAGGRAALIAPDPDLTPDDPVSVVLGVLDAAAREALGERCAHVREVLTGFRSGSAELAGAGEPRPAYAPGVALMARHAAKAAELGVQARTVERWVAAYRRGGEAGLAPRTRGEHALGRVDTRWCEVALEVMAEHRDQSTPSRKMVIERTAARLSARYGAGSVPCPSRSAAYRALEELERRCPTFRLSAVRNRDIAARPADACGKLRPARPGEYVLMDTTRLDVFGLDPVTLRWCAAELTVAMDWYTRCVTGIRLTPVSAKAVDAAAVLFQVLRPRPAPEYWPAGACWPEHGIPRSVLIDPEAIAGPIKDAAASPALAPETIVIDHGKIYVSDHVTSVCRRMGISIQPVRLRTGRDKGPVERFFRTLREDLLQALPGYKGPDLHGRGADPEGEAFFFLDELEAIIRDWVGCVYHVREHGELVDPGVPGLRMSPAAMFEHGIARAGYLMVPRGPELAFEFLAAKWRKIHHYGVQIGSRRYNAPVLAPFRGASSRYPGGLWPVHVDPDDVTRVYFNDPASGTWHTLRWEHAPVVAMPLSEDALGFARRLAAGKYRFPDDRIAVADLLERWKIGLGATLSERRIALRTARSAPAIELPPTPESHLPSVAHALEPSPAESGPEPLCGDDDVEDADGGSGDFYADAFEDA
jgi:transposase InsO family protein